jgi:hypothetical protein
VTEGIPTWVCVWRAGALEHQKDGNAQKQGKGMGWERGLTNPNLKARMKGGDKACARLPLRFCSFGLWPCWPAPPHASLLVTDPRVRPRPKLRAHAIRPLTGARRAQRSRIWRRRSWTWARWLRRATMAIGQTCASSSWVPPTMNVPWRTSLRLCRRPQLCHRRHPDPRPCTLSIQQR